VAALSPAFWQPAKLKLPNRPAQTSQRIFWRRCCAIGLGAVGGDEAGMQSGFG